MQHKSGNKQGFSLIELLVVITIITALLGVAIPNFLGARQRARDAKKKAELRELKSALRLYYNDYQKYPADFSGMVGGKFKANIIQGCGADGDQICPCSSSIDFAAGGTGCDVVFMKKFPSDLGNNTMSYFDYLPEDATPSDFCLKVTLETVSDSDILTSQSRCSAVCSAATGGTPSTSEYVTCAD